MLPTPEQFARDAGALGIGDDDMVVVYDGAGIFSAPRVWWTLKAMGHDKVAVLDGGMPAWKAAGGALEKGPARPIAVTFTPRPNGGPGFAIGSPMLRRLPRAPLGNCGPVHERSAWLVSARKPKRPLPNDAAKRTKPKEPAAYGSRRSRDAVRTSGARSRRKSSAGMRRVTTRQQHFFSTCA